MIQLTIADPSLVLLLGSAGSGKSTFARHHFRPTEIVSSDHCRALICDDENEQAVNADAFGLLHHLTRLRLRWKKLTAIDATNLQTHAREPLLRIARDERVPVFAIVLHVSAERCAEQNRSRTERVVPDEILQQHQAELAQARQQLPAEGYAAIYELNEQQIAEAKIVREIILPSRKKSLEDQLD
jgi:predicted kinase